MMKPKILFPVLCLLIMVYIHPAIARDLAEAASSAQTLFNRIGIAAISLGITAGGILFAIGMAQVGRMVLISGLIGAFLVLGAPAIINLLARIFGVSV